jgi:hypothetical protein
MGLHDTFAELRSPYGEAQGGFDGSEPFMTNGHQILSPHSVGEHGKRSVPGWARNNKEFQALLLREFPKMATDEKQRFRAGRWTRVVTLYYRAAMSAQQVADETGWTVSKVKSLLKCIRRVARGWRCDNRKAKGLTPRGRRKGSKVITDAIGQYVVPPEKHDPKQLPNGINELVEYNPDKTSLGRGTTSPGTPIPRHPGEVLTSASPSN